MPLSPDALDRPAAQTPKPSIATTSPIPHDVAEPKTDRKMRCENMIQTPAYAIADLPF